MSKAMIFIDGTWLNSNTFRLANGSDNTSTRIDHGLLPIVLCKKVKEFLKLSEVDLVRTLFFSSIAVNFDLGDEEYVQKTSSFFDILRREFNYDLHIFPINYCGRHLRRFERGDEDDFEPKEKCVDIAFASSLLYYAAIPGAYDIAILIIGDKDFLPAIKFTRQLGKRIVIVSIEKCCAHEYIDPQDKALIRDCDIIWLNKIFPEIELKFIEKQIECQSPLHEGDRLVWTTYKPLKDTPFFCDECREKFAEQKSEAQKNLISNKTNEILYEKHGNISPEATYFGKIKHVFEDKGYGFIRDLSGREYFFHLTDLVGIDWYSVHIDMKVKFQVKKEPSEDRAGAAGAVSPFD